jgi:hypothetical protein
MEYNVDDLLNSLREFRGQGLPVKVWDDFYDIYHDITNIEVDADGTVVVTIV